MANVARPPLRQTRLSFSPVAAAAAADAHSHALHALHTPHTSPAASTRRTSRISLQHQAAPQDLPLAPLNRRKRPAAALRPDAPDAPIAPDVSDARPSPKAGPLLASDAEKRSLRSHDGGSRLKSELPTYFANYADVMAGLPLSSAHAELLDLDTPVYVVDEHTATPTLPSTPTDTTPTTAALTTHSTRSTTFHVLDYSNITAAMRTDSPLDPLADSLFFASHRRAERKEKQLRNIEKERAMHEKAQLERLLDGLQGPDWLKVVGITGVTDGERKDWEPKRDYFVREVEALVDKFRLWKEQEKRLRAEKEAALAAQDASSHDASEDASADDQDDDQIEDTSTPTAHTRPPHHPLPRSHPKLPSPPKPRRPPRPHGFLLPAMPPEPLAPFMSFYAKPHLRAAALGKHRQGRNATAFGQPVPEWEEKVFELPRGVLADGVLRDNARRRRRQKREGGAL